MNRGGCTSRISTVIARRLAAVAGILACFTLVLASPLVAQEVVLKGGVFDPQGNGLPKASIQFLSHDVMVAEVVSGPDGTFEIDAATPGMYVARVAASGFQTVTSAVTVEPHDNSEIKLHLTQLAPQVTNVTVTADANDLDVISPDPSEKFFVRQDLLDANPGRPGAPVSIPGYPIETASSGIKAPQYFAPGVAGDHGEPIAQYIEVGSYLLPNNLSANAHGNGYADPNVLIPQIIESVQVDGGAYNVREGNHAVNLAAAYGLRSHFNPFATLTAEYRDLDLVAGFSPSQQSFVAIDLSYGNGFLSRLEHRQQYKLNGQRIYETGNHHFTLLGLGYYGFSYIPGLVPTGAAFVNYGDTIDPRQRDQTHTAVVALNDVWSVSTAQQLQLSGFFRTYNLSLYSDFGHGLIRQSEFRTVAGSSANYINKVSESITLLGGLDYNREAPRRDNLDRYGLPNPEDPRAYGPFTKVYSNNLTLTSITPYGAASGVLGRYFRYYAGWRRDQIDIQNDDLINPGNSFQKWVGVNSPKATASFLPKPSWHIPLLSLSFGQSFFTEDPRIGLGTGAGTLVATSHSYQLVASKTLNKTDFKLTLSHVTSSQELAKIDADTGMQEDQGPSRLRFLSAAVRRNFSHGSILATFSEADARDLNSRSPVPEAPRTIFDLLASVQRLPLGLQAQGEFEFVGRKPLGTGCAPDPNAQCTGNSVRELRVAIARSFQNGRWDVGMNMLLANGYSGQTTESFYPSDVQEVVGVRIPSYTSLNVTYRFGHPSAR